MTAPKKVNSRRARIRSTGLGLALAVLLGVSPALAGKKKDPPPPPPPIDVPVCFADATAEYGAGFKADDFSLTSVNVDANGHLYLETGNQGITPDSIVIPFEQDVWASFFYEDAGYQSTLGWMLYKDAVDSNGNFLGWNNIPADKKPALFRRIADGSGGGDGILDIVQNATEASAAAYDDGTGSVFVVDGDGQLTPKDMKKHLGRFAAETELVFYLGADQDVSSKDSSRFFFTKTLWNPDSFTSCNTITRTYVLDQPSSGDCSTSRKGLLDSRAIDRLNTYFGLSLSGSTPPFTVEKGAKFPHVLVAAPKQDPNQWILSWEDISGGGDMDYNDTTFRIERKTGGTARLKETRAITPPDRDAYFTGVTFEVFDSMPGGECAGKTEIKYFLSIDNGSKWVEITNWDEVSTVIFIGGQREPGNPLLSWTPGTPAETYRAKRVDFAGLGVSGRELTWKAVMVSDKESCVPKVMEAYLTGTVAKNQIFSRAAPVMVGNVLFTGSYETPALTWTEKRPRGHIKALELYNPANDLKNKTIPVIWDGGEKLKAQPASGRTIFFPDISVRQVSGEVLEVLSPAGKKTTTGDGVTRTFTGRLKSSPLVASTLVLSAGTQTFSDVRNDELASDWGKGTINRGTGEFTVTFNSPPAAGIPFKASYSYYTKPPALETFTAAKTSDAMLALDDAYIIPTGYRHDFNKDGTFNASDRAWLVDWFRGKDWSSGKDREWKLGAVDHSVPAVLTAPGLPAWYFGTDISEKERQDYEEFRSAHQTRDAVLFIGARDGMLHAFDAGKFRWDTRQVRNDNNYKYRGFFEKQDYGTGNELWAFIPANLLPRLKNHLLMGDDQAYVDASPSIADVKIKGRWRSVLLAAEGNGGDSVFCLDVTDPRSPQFLWEYTDASLFRSRSSPAVGQIGQVLVNGTPKWAAFFVSGKADANQFPSVYMIDIADGTLIERIYLDSEPAGKGGVPSGQPAILDTDGNGYIDRFYVATDKGRVYKVNLGDSPSEFVHAIGNCVVNTDFVDEDAGKDSFGNPVSDSVPEDQRWHPIYGSPSVVVDHKLTTRGTENHVRIFFGTGDSPYYDEDINTGNTTYHFFAYDDMAEKGVCSEEKVKLDWFTALPSGHRVFASAFAAAGKIYFGTATSETENPCEGQNAGKLFVVDMDDPGQQTVIETGDIMTQPIVNDEHVFVNGEMRGGDKFNNPTKSKVNSDTKVKTWREIRN